MLLHLDAINALFEHYQKVHIGYPSRAALLALDMLHNNLLTGLYHHT
jgi:hypothetical protein